MQHMSLLKRRLYFYSFCLVFFIVIPILIFYANGYRLTKDWQISETGGIYVYASESYADISLDGVKRAQSGIFQRGVLLDGLKAGTYAVTVSKDGFFSWKKDLSVKNGLVSEGHPFLISDHLEVVSIPELATSTLSTSTKVKNPDYAGALLLFQKQPLKAGVATTTPYGDNALINGNLVVSEKGDTIYALWLGDTNSMPYFFCNQAVCDANTSATSTIYTYALPKSHIDFLPGRNDVILVSTAEGIDAVELDTKEPQNIVLVYPTKTADFRVSSGVLYIKDGTEISKINL
ncbi:MAG: hypothetical protein PHV42_00420 [Candidatus Pacebacteria bacterium]|nr:hypothetical protein [Candidatus Paceibacterota bacterium]